MPDNVRRLTGYGLLLLAFLNGCSGSESDQGAQSGQNRRLTVAVTSWPLLQMAQTVAGEHASVSLVVPTGRVSRSWQPTADDVTRMQQAELVLFSGAGYEPWRNHVSLSVSRVVDTAEGYYSEFIRIPDAVMHQHGPEGGHSHPGTVWATWLDPQLALSQLNRVEQALATRNAAAAADFRRNAKPLTAPLEKIDEQLAEVVKNSAKIDFQLFSDGPYYQYLAKRLDRQLVYLHWPEDQTELTDDQREQLRKAAAGGPPVIFLLRSDCSQLQKEFATSVEVTVVSVDLMEQNAEDSAGLIDRMQRNVDNLKRAIDLQRTQP